MPGFFDFFSGGGDESGTASGKAEMTAAEYARYLVQKDARASAELRRQNHENERKMRKELEDKYREHGRRGVDQSAASMSTVKVKLEETEEAKLVTGQVVRRGVEDLKKAHAERHQIWMARAEEISRDFGVKQQRRIKQSSGETLNNKRAAAASAAAARSEREHLRSEQKKKELEDAKLLHLEIDESTSGEVIKQSKDQFYRQRKAAHDQGTATYKAGKLEQQLERQAYAAKAKEAKAAAIQAKLAAKEAMETLRTERSKAAQEARRERGYHGGKWEQRKTDLDLDKKSVHGQVKSAKYIAPEIAEKVLISHRARHGARPRLSGKGSPSSPASAPSSQRAARSPSRR